MWHPLRPRGNDPNLDQDEAPPAPAANRPSSVNHAQLLVANRALELIGKELGLFINRKDITVRKDDLDDLSGKELALEYARTAQLLLESYARDEEEDKGPVSRGMPMKAVFIERHGGPEVPKFGEMPDPVAASGEVVVDITLLVGR